MSGPADRDGWAMQPQDTRERTCEYAAAGVFDVFHHLRVARAPDPTATTVTRVYEVTVEWTSRLGLPAWLETVADTCTPYGGDRFGDGVDRAAADDGRFRSAPADATFRPPEAPDPAMSDPYHYWNTPLGRVQGDEGYPADASSLTVDPTDGPDAVWTDDSTAGIPAEHLPEERSAYARVGLEFVGRERLQRSADRSGDRPRDGSWRHVGECTTPTTDHLAATVDRSLAAALGDDWRDALATVEAQIDAVADAFAADGAGDPYRIPERAVEAATTRPR